MDCLLKDSDMYSNDASSPASEILFSNQLYVYGFIYELLSEGIGDKRVRIFLKTGTSVWEFMTPNGFHVLNGSIVFCSIQDR